MKTVSALLLLLGVCAVVATASVHGSEQSANATAAAQLRAACEPAIRKSIARHSDVTDQKVINEAIDSMIAYHLALSRQDIEAVLKDPPGSWLPPDAEDLDPIGQSNCLFTGRLKQLQGGVPRAAAAARPAPPTVGTTAAPVTAATTSAAPQAPAVAPATAKQIAAARLLVMQDSLSKLVAVEAARSGTGATFDPMDKNSVFRASVKGALKNTESLEVLVEARENVVIFSVYPNYKDPDYVNLSDARDKVGLMRAMLKPALDFDAFRFFWGIDDEGDIYCAFHIATSLGFPADAVTRVIRNLRLVDTLFGGLRPLIDGSQEKK